MPDLEGREDWPSLQSHPCIWLLLLFSKGKKGESSNSGHEFEDFRVKFHLVLIVLSSIVMLCKNTFNRERDREIHVDLETSITSDFKCKGKLLLFFPHCFCCLWIGILVGKGFGEENKNSFKNYSIYAKG